MSRAKQRPLPMGALIKKYKYCEQSGIITLRSSGKRAGWTHPSGYSYLCIQENGKKRNLLYHRVAFALYYGVDPYPLEVDHIDRNKDNNIISNLRVVTFREQSLNRQFGMKDIINDNHSQLLLLTKHGTLPTAATIQTFPGEYTGHGTFQLLLF